MMVEPNYGHLDAEIEHMLSIPVKPKLRDLAADIRAARDAEWRAAVERVRRLNNTLSGSVHNAALDALLAAMEAKR